MSYSHYHSSKSPFRKHIDGHEDKDKLKPVPDNRNVLEKGWDWFTGDDSRATMSIGGKTVEYTDGKGNPYDKDKNKLNQ